MENWKHFFWLLLYTILRKIKGPAISQPIQPSGQRAGALAGVELALEPEGKKSVLMQLSSFELKKILKTLITLD